MNKQKWGPIFKKTATGKTQCWTIYVEGPQIITEFGQWDGAIQIAKETIKEGKNIGRSNETTPEQQAALEAESRYTKKLKKDYVLDRDPKAGAVSDLIDGGILPMLAHKFSEHGDKLKYPCAVQPKLDGHRCIAMSTGLWSRTRKLITGVPHILEAYLDATDGGCTPWDGELYEHSYHDKFEQLTHFIRQKEPAAGHDVVQYHVYDTPGKGTFRQRYEYLQKVLCHKYPTCLQLVETRWVNDEDELMLAFEDFLAQGYEGAIARNADGLYVNKRSYDLLKIKKFDDGEFEVVGVKEGKGRLAGHGIFEAKTKDGQLFRAKMKGALMDLRKYFMSPDQYVGEMLTVQYQGVSKDGIPRFPIAIRIRQKI